jgi:UDP-N-acetylmuramate--alanine ligase
MDTYGHDFAKLKAAFVEFIHRMPFYGAAILCFDDPGVRSIIPMISRPIVTYGFREDAMVRAVDVRARDGKMSFTVHRHNGVRMPDLAVTLNLPGEHNVLNALAALGAAGAAGVELAAAAAALADFAGTGRRFEPRGRTAAGALVYDDYAHHPTEVRATLEAARTLEARRVVACFQPHLYSRTRMLAREFGDALALADLIVVLDVYRARERPEDFPGVTGYLVAEAAADAAHGRPVWWLPEPDDAERQLRGELEEGDLLVTIGAGNVDELARRLTS